MIEIAFETGAPASPKWPLALALLVLSPAAAFAARPTTTIWVAEATEKIAADEPARPASVSARISAARNEFEAFQVIVTGSARAVRASATPLSQPGAAPITDVRLYQAALMSVAQPSAADSVTGRIPDALIPDVDEVVNERRNAFPFEVRSNESRAIWVEVFVPKAAAPGVYTGSVTVSHSKGQTVVPVELTVWNFELPSISSVRSAFGLYGPDLPAGHGFSGSDTTTFATLRARYGQFALDHRVTLPFHDDWMFNDLFHFDRYYGALVDGTAPTRLQGARLTAVQYLGNLTDSANMARWAAHFREHDRRNALNGSPPWWFDHLFQYTCDEPPYQGCDWPEIAVRARAAKAADPEFRTLVTTSIQEANAHAGAQYIDLLVPIVNFMDGKSGTPYAGNQRSKYDAFLASGPLKELWLYQACDSHGCGGTSSYSTGWPSYMIDTWGVRNRAMQWLVFRYQATGELYWDTTYAYTLGDPWVSQWAFTGHGDGTLFYPGTPAKIGGTTHIPVASIRLKLLREGMEDYEYLKRVSDLGDPGFANTIADSLFPNAYSSGARSSADTEAARTIDLMAARQRLAQRILQLQASSAAR
jgi:hypothetical protein